MSNPFDRLQLRHFRLIEAVTEYGQISIAAEKLGMTQPAASRSLAEIERIVEVPLFERQPKGVKPTPIGAMMSRHASNLLSDFSRGSEELLSFRSGYSGCVRVGAVTGAAVGYVVPAVHALKREAPTADVGVVVAPSAVLMTALLSGELDMALCRVPPQADKERLLYIQGCEEHVEILVRAGHPLLAEKNLTLDKLSGLTWIQQARGMPLRDAMVQLHIETGISPPQDVIESSSLLLTMAYLKISDAVAPVSREVEQLLIQGDSSEYAVLSMKHAISISPYHLTLRDDQPLSPIAQRLLELVKEMLPA